MEETHDDDLDPQYEREAFDKLRKCIRKFVEDVKKVAEEYPDYYSIGDTGTDEDIVSRVYGFLHHEELPTYDEL